MGFVPAELDSFRANVSYPLLVVLKQRCDVLRMDIEFLVQTFQTFGSAMVYIT